MYTIYKQHKCEINWSRFLKQGSQGKGSSAFLTCGDSRWKWKLVHCPSLNRSRRLDMQRHGHKEIVTIPHEIGRSKYAICSRGRSVGTILPVAMATLCYFWLYWSSLTGLRNGDEVREIYALRSAGRIRIHRHYTRETAQNTGPPPPTTSCWSQAVNDLVPRGATHTRGQKHHELLRSATQLRRARLIARQV